MEEKNISVLLIDKLVELHELEIKKAKVLAAIFTKTTKEIMDKKLQALQCNFEQQAEFYGQNLERYEDIYDQILLKYKKQLTQIMDKYNEFYINLQLELQEAECNQKIAITNLKKSSDIKQEMDEQVQEEMLENYKKSMQKKINYDVIIKACEDEIEECSIQMQEQINLLFGDKLSQISIKEKSSFGSFFRKLKNKLIGARKFNTYVVEPICVELEMMDHKLPDIINHIRQDTIHFVAKIKQAKDETNKIFEHSING